MRPPIFELHILPMIRAIDREHMLFAFDLWDYDQLVQHAEQIADRLMGNMPPATDGGRGQTSGSSSFDAGLPQAINRCNSAVPNTLGAKVGQLSQFGQLALTQRAVTKDGFN